MVNQEVGPSQLINQSINHNFFNPDNKVLSSYKISIKRYQCEQTKPFWNQGPTIRGNESEGRN